MRFFSLFGFLSRVSHSLSRETLSPFRLLSPPPPPPRVARGHKPFQQNERKPLTLKESNKHAHGTRSILQYICRTCT
jgi:hypothetical protein